MSAVERTLSILEMIAASRNGLSNSDLSRRLDIPKSSASYILRVLERREYLRRDFEGKYRLGLKVMDLTGGAIPGTDVREAAKPFLIEFLQKCQLPEAHVAVLDNGRAVYVEKVEGEKSFIKMDNCDPGIAWNGTKDSAFYHPAGEIPARSGPGQKIRFCC
jgi:DNA-binding IclR family transcriptional regulator